MINQFNYVEIHSDVNETNELSFGVDSGIDLSNTKPDGFSFVGEYTKVSIGWIYCRNLSIFPMIWIQKR